MKDLTDSSPPPINHQYSPKMNKFCIAMLCKSHQGLMSPYLCEVCKYNGKKDAVCNTCYNLATPFLKCKECQKAAANFNSDSSADEESTSSTAPLIQNAGNVGVHSTSYGQKK